MCGIIGCAGGDDNIVSILLSGLEKLEYRGYDSTGLAVSNSDIHVVKRKGDLDELIEPVETRIKRDGMVGVGHTRWSTHGNPADHNAHPHTDCENRVAVVHNGIIENHQQLREELTSLGHEFESETDTEVVPHLIGHYLDNGSSPRMAFYQAVEKIDGSFAIAVIFESLDQVMATRRDSSLVIGIGDETYVASDMTALIEHTNSVIHLQDGDFAFLSDDGYTIVNRNGTPQSKTQTTIEWEEDEVIKGHYDHYMMKEIHEQPSALRDCLRDRFTQDESISLSALNDCEDLSTVHFVACGTSYHAALFGAKIMRENGIQAQAFLASEYAMAPAPVRDETLVVGVTQSGETADTLAALRMASEKGARTLALTNVVGSTASQECDEALYIRSGPEISVAATKTFASQLVTLVLSSLMLSSNESKRGTKSFVSALKELPGQLEHLIDNTDAMATAHQFADSNGYFFIGRGLQYPVALEGALKMKEITYEHAEGFAAGELKHGPLSLVTEETPVFVSVVGDDETTRKTVANAEEVKARDAPLVAVTDGNSSVENIADEVLRIPSTNRELAPILVNVQYQLLAYHTADFLGRDIDKPRNLAKCVTVQ